MAGVKVNERSNAVCFAVFIEWVSVIGRIGQEFFNMKPGKIGSHREKSMQEGQHIMPGSTLKHWKNGKVVFRIGSNKHVEMVAEKNLFLEDWKNPIPSCSQAVKTSVCSHSHSLLGSRRSFWNVPALQFREWFRHWQVKAVGDLSVSCGRMHQGTGLCIAGR